MSGEIHVSVQWRFDPGFDFDSCATRSGGDQPPNELRMAALMKGGDLLVKDKPVLWAGTSDPRVRSLRVRE